MLSRVHWYFMAGLSRELSLQHHSEKAWGKPEDQQPERAGEKNVFLQTSYKDSNKQLYGCLCLSMLYPIS